MRYPAILLLALLLHLNGFAQQWKELGPCGSNTYGNTIAAQSGTGQIHCIAFDPDNKQVVYAGSAYGGLWRSIDGGKNWSNTNLDATEALEWSSVGDIAISKTGNKKTIWVATGHPGARGRHGEGFEVYTTGIYFSTDEGRTFQPLKTFNTKLHFQFADRKHISRLIVHPKNPAIIYVATSDGLYQTTNTGKTWKLVLKEDELPGNYEYTQGIADVEFSVTDPDHVVYASGRDVYRSVKAGKRGSFKSLTRYGSAMDLDDDCLRNLNFWLDVNTYNGRQDVLYANAYFQGDTCGPYKGRGGCTLFYYDGNKWIQRNNFTEFGMADAIRVKVASVPGNPAIVYAGAVTTGFSSDTGKTWFKATDYNQPGHADIHAIEIIPGTSDMITGTDGGIFRFHYDTRKVEEYNNGLCLAQTTDMSTSVTNPNKILLGMQDVGSALYDGNAWKKLPFSGDGYPGQYIDVTDEYHMYTCHNSYFSYTNSGPNLQWKNYSLCINTLGNFPNNITQHPLYPNRYYYIGKEIYQSDSFGINNSWCQVSDFQHAEKVWINPYGQQIAAFRICESNPDIMYAAFNALPECCNSYLFKTTKGAIACSGNGCKVPTSENNWQLMNLPRIETGDAKTDFSANSLYGVSDLVVNDSNPQELWISFSFQEFQNPAFKLYHSSDGGLTWSPDEAGLPNYPGTKLVYIKGSDGELFLGTYNRVYYKKRNQPWCLYGEGLPHTYIVDMEINYAAGKLRVGTFGRGVWEIALPVH